MRYHSFNNQQVVRSVALAYIEGNLYLQANASVNRNKIYVYTADIF